MNNDKIIVVDVGGRYGIHPTWKGLEDTNIEFHLFDPDPNEYKRLINKYKDKNNLNEFKINSQALGSKKGTLMMKILANEAMSGSYTRKKRRLFSGEKEEEVKVKEEIKVEQITLDSYCKINNVEPDFLKIDTEGHELEVINGTEKMIKNILGIRVEVSLNSVFTNGAKSEKIFEILHKENFTLINIDYLGQGELQHKYTSSRQRYGVIDIVDTVWIKNEYVSQEAKKINVLNKLIKIAIFCFKNNAPDLALALLEENKIELKKYLRKYKNNNLINKLGLLCEKHFYQLKWEPNQQIKEHIKWYKEIFNKDLPTGSKFMESLIHNPN